MFLCSHKDITRQKWHHQQQQQQQKLAKLHQQQVLFASAATASSALGQAAPSNLLDQAEPAHEGADQPAEPTSPRSVKGAQAAPSSEPGQDAEDNQQLISLDEFGLDENNNESGDFDQDDQDEHQGDKHTASQYSRRRSRAVLYQLSGHFNERRSVNMKTKLKLNNVSTVYLAGCLMHKWQRKCKCTRRQ